MFRIEVQDIISSKFDLIYGVVLYNLNIGMEPNKPISVGDFIKIFHTSFNDKFIKVAWDPEFPDARYVWRKGNLSNYRVINTIPGVSFELDDPILDDAFPENHDIKTEDSCPVKSQDQNDLNRTLDAAHETANGDKIVDSGKRMSFGEDLAEREPADGKGRYDLITPFGIRRLAIWCELGAKKYADRNWEKGMPFSRYIDAAKRHLDKYIMGMTDEDHLAAAAWNILAIMHHEELGQTELDDMPHYMGS